MTQLIEAPADQLVAPDPAGAVSLAYVHTSRVSFSWHHSVIELMGYDFANAARIVRGGFVAIRCGTDGLVDARNMAIKQFLDDRAAEWLFWTDTDMGFAADTVERLVSVADVDERPVVGALAFSYRQLESDNWGGWRSTATPTVFDWETVDEKQGFTVRWNYARNTVTRVAGTGAACILIHRSVLERIADKYGPVWYDRIPNPTMGNLTSEDLSFCMRAGTLDIPIHVHTGVLTTHHKDVWVAEDDYLRQRLVDDAIARTAAAKAGETA